MQQFLLIQSKDIGSLIKLRMDSNFKFLNQILHIFMILANPSRPNLHWLPSDCLQPRIITFISILF